MKHLFTTITAAAVLLVSTGISAIPATAAAPQEMSAECDLTALLVELEKVQAQGVTTSVTIELDLRKQILGKSMKCNTEEAIILEGALKKIEGNSPVASVLRERYERQLVVAQVFTKNQVGRIAALTTIESTKEVARELKEWRMSTYNPIAWEASQLIVMDRNLSLAESALVRLGQLETIVQGDELTQLATAKQHIEDAQDSLYGAIVLLRDNPKTQQEQITNAQKIAMDDLSKAYTILLEINADEPENN